MISVLIPTHRPNFLRETVESVLDQTCSDFEIVVVPNQGAEVAGILPADPRIRVVPYEGPNRIGAIKRFAFTQGEGELLLELDHDDLLAPNALEKIVEAQEKTV